MPNMLRILDANFNRAREALRVMEEAARFVLNDQQLTKALKNLRHDLTSAMGKIPGLVHHRDTPGDVGTTITTATEQSRASVAEVTISAGKRLSEALRVIEEYTKTLPKKAGGNAQAIEQLRYRGYTLEQHLTCALPATKEQQFRLCVLITELLCLNHDWQAVARASIEAGADCIQLREKKLTDIELLNRAKWLVDLCQQRNVAIVINDRPDIALLAGASGIHLGQGDLPCRQIRKLVGNELVIGVSTTGLDQARQAVGNGADYCGVGPMFATTTKHKDTLAGPSYLKTFTETFPHVPHLAIGGITCDNIKQLVDAGVRGIAVSSAICGAQDPATIIHELLSAMPS